MIDLITPCTLNATNIVILSMSLQVYDVLIGRRSKYAISGSKASASGYT